ERVDVRGAFVPRARVARAAGRRRRRRAPGGSRAACERADGRRARRRRARRGRMTEARTPLDVLHRELGARMVTFAGYALPVSYASGIVREHEHTRERASVFDVSHMGQILVTGADAAAALEALMPTDLVNLGEGRQRYAMLTSEAGGVLDDLMVARLDEGFLLVVNAARKADDLARIEAHVQEIGYDD